MSSKILIDVESVTGSHHALIIMYPTGILYSAQAGGMVCAHPSVEGFVMSLNPDLFKDFGSGCDYGCWGGEDWNDEERKEATTKLDVKLQLLNTNNFSAIHYARADFRFDWDRIDQLMENWWPVIVSATYLDIMEEPFVPPRDFRGIICTGNCD